MRVRALVIISALCMLGVAARANESADEQVLLDNYIAQELRCSHTFTRHSRQDLAHMIGCADTGMREKFDALSSPNADIYDMMFERHQDIRNRLLKRAVTWAQASDELQLLGQQIADEANRRAQALTQGQVELQKQAQAQDDLRRRQRAAQCAYGAYLMGAGRGSATEGAIRGEAQLAYCRALGLPVPASIPSPRTTDTTCSADAAGIVHCTTQ